MTNDQEWYQQRRERQPEHRSRFGRSYRLDQEFGADDPAPVLSNGAAPAWPRADAAALETLREAHITSCQLVPWGSNYTFAVVLQRGDGDETTGIYKPGRGEAPLWDFDAGTLYRREYASYLLSCLLDWRFIPPTVVREGPHGVGTVQLYVEPDTHTSDQVLLRDHAAALRRIFLFDLLANNADRKASHCFLGRHDRLIWGIDHGLTFHVHPKLRTVLWNFCGEPIPADLLKVLEALEREAKRVRATLRPYLDRAEIDMLFSRVRNLRESQVFPMLNPRRNIPYGW